MLNNRYREQAKLIPSIACEIRVSNQCLIPLSYPEAAVRFDNIQCIQTTLEATLTRPHPTFCHVSKTEATKPFLSKQPPELGRAVLYTSNYIACTFGDRVSNGL